VAPQPTEPPAGRIDTEARDGILTLRIANPDRANALDDAMLARLAAAFSGPEAREARVVLLGGAGDRHFSAGYDLQGAVAAGDPVDALRAGERLLGEAVRALRACPRPVIAVLNGAAMGGALELAMACDWRLAARGARFAMPPARLGIVYTAAGLRAFAEAVGLPRTRELFLTGRAVEADEALAIGLVNRVLEQDELWPAAERDARAVADGAPIAVGGMTAVLRDVDDARLAERWRERAYASEDLREGLAAFRERRPGRFAGR
jgi:enoyl-CoA hydratase/carnithine racemase